MSEIDTIFLKTKMIHLLQMFSCHNVVVISNYIGDTITALMRSERQFGAGESSISGRIKLMNFFFLRIPQLHISSKDCSSLHI